MTINHMKEVANLLGVELDEEFRTKEKELGDYVFKFTHKQFLTRANGRDAWFESIILTEFLNGKWEIEKIILDKQEKEYLSNVIKPFRDRVQSFAKNGGVEYEWLEVFFKDDDAMCFPTFKKGTMYKNMKINKEYSLNDLGI